MKGTEANRVHGGVARTTKTKEVVVHGAEKGR